MYRKYRPLNQVVKHFVIEKCLISSVEISDFIWHLLEHELCRRISTSGKGIDIDWAFTSHSYICIQLPQLIELCKVKDSIWNSNSWSTLEYQETNSGPRGRIVEECYRHENNVFKTLENTISSNLGYWTIPSETIANTTSSLLINPINIKEHNHCVNETPTALSNCDVLATHYRVSETMALVEVRLTQIDDALALPLFLIFSDYSKLFEGFRETMDEWVDLNDSSYLVNTRRSGEAISIRIYLNGDVDSGVPRVLNMIQSDTVADLTETTNTVNHNIANVSCKHRLSVTSTNSTHFVDHQSVTGLLGSIRISAYSCEYSDMSDKFNHFPRLTMDEIRTLERYSGLDEIIFDILRNKSPMDKKSSHREISLYVTDTIEWIKKHYIHLYKNANAQHRILVIYENRISYISELKQAIYDTCVWYGTSSKDNNGGYIHIASCFNSAVPAPKYPDALYAEIHLI